MSRDSHTLRGLRILVVEDWLEIAQEIEYILEDLGCIVVGPVPRVERAQRLLNEQSPDAAVLDVNLGDEETSIPIARRLRNAGVPFVFATGFDSLQELDEFDDAPVVNKPFGATDLARALESVIERRGHGAAEHEQSEPWT